MILDRVTFSYENQVLIEKIKIQPPIRYQTSFENSGCFIYFKENAPKLLSAETNVQVESKEAVLLKCGNHFLDLLRKTEDDEVEVIVFHLYPDLLKKLYLSDLPNIIEKGELESQAKLLYQVIL